jgi:hypothetical protein
MGLSSAVLAGGLAYLVVAVLLRVVRPRELWASRHEGIRLLTSGRAA